MQELWKILSRDYILDMFSNLHFVMRYWSFWITSLTWYTSWPCEVQLQI